MSGRYTDVLGSVSASAKSAAHAAEIVAALAPPPVKLDVAGGEDTAHAAMVAAKPAPSSSVVGSAFALAPGLIGGGVGAYAWKEHRVLGFLAGHAIAQNARPILRGSDAERRNAYCLLGVEGAGIAGAMLLKKYMHPVFGWMLGTLAGVAASSFVPGSPVNNEYAKLTAKTEPVT